MNTSRALIKLVSKATKASLLITKPKTMMMKQHPYSFLMNMINQQQQARNFFGYENNNNNNANNNKQQTNGQQQETTTQKTTEQQKPTEEKPTTEQQETKKEETTQQQTQQDDAKIKELQKEIEQLKEKNTTLEDQLKRSVAEMQNVRRIAKNDVDNAKKYALSGFAKNLLEVIDNLETALKHIKLEDVEEIMKLIPENNEELLKKSKIMKTSVEGIKLTENVFLKCLENNGIKKIELDAESKFDPNFHEAMMKIPASEKNPHNTVAMVLKSGWMINDRCLRPAQVIVAIQD
ncbi:hypothetical protein ABK040_000218 [Willaertia magna]